MTIASHTKKCDDLIYDVGMHKGEDTDYYIRKGFRVVAFEADPDLAEQCRTRFRRELESGILTIVEGAIVEPDSADDRRQSIRFIRNKENTVWGTVADDWASRNESLGTSNEVIEVPVVNFQKCLEQHGIPHYLKIDIEGMDTVCLKALASFPEKPDYVSIESEKVSFSKLVEEISLLRQLGYIEFKAVQQAGISHQKEPNPSKEGVYAGHHFIEGSSGLFGSDLSGNWKNETEILDQYKLIFRQYEWFGDHGVLTRTVAGKALRSLLRKLLRSPLPGWYDTHAKHSSAAS